MYSQSQFLKALLLSFIVFCFAHSADAATISDLQRRAADGDVEAQTELGSAYLNGTIVDNDFKQARFWLEQAALKGNARAQNNYAHLLVFGKGGPEDILNGVGWFEKSIAQGYQAAEYNLATLMEEGVRITANTHEIEPDEVQFGLPVEVMFEELPDGQTLYRFKKREA